MKPSVEIRFARLTRQWVGNVLLLGAFLFTFIGILDYVITPDNFRTFMAVRLLMSAVLIGLFFLNRLGTSVRYHFGIVLVTAVLSAIAIEFMILRLGGARSPYYAGMNIIVICCLGFVPLNLAQSVTLLAVVYGIYLGPVLRADVLTDPLFVNNNVFLCSTCIIALALRWQGQKRIMSELSLLDALEEKRQTLQRSAEEMQQQNEEMKSFTSIVSHDLRAPLVNIKGFSGELRVLAQEIERVVGNGAPADRGGTARLHEIVGHDLPQVLEYIEASVQRMDGQISALLTLSRIGRRELAPEVLDMDDLVRGLLVTLAHQVEEKRAAVVVGVLPCVTADRTAMEQIMGNLLDNALKYLEPGREGRLKVTGERNADHVAFSVRDNGRGMTAEDIPRAFEIFRRVGRQDVPGEGMGLAYVKALVRRHGGRIGCESEPGAGAAFTFTIPADGQQGHRGGEPGERP